VQLFPFPFPFPFPLQCGVGWVLGLPLLCVGVGVPESCGVGSVLGWPEPCGVGCVLGEPLACGVEEGCARPVGVPPAAPFGPVVPGPAGDGPVAGPFPAGGAPMMTWASRWTGAGSIWV